MLVKMLFVSVMMAISSPSASVAAVEQQLCKNAMPEQDFSLRLTVINQVSSEASRIESVRDLIRYNCFKVDQIKRLLNSLASESNRLEIALLAYNRCTEKKIYSRLAGSFSSPVNRDHLLQLTK